MRRLSPRRLGGLLLALALSVGLAAGAFAFWIGDGDGTATTVLADTQPLGFEPGTPTAQLYPGDDANVAIVVSNSNPYFVHIGSMIVDSEGGEPFGVDAGHSECDVSVLSFEPQDNSGAGWQIPPRAGSTDGTLVIDMPAAMSMSASAASACQGATFTVHLEART